MLDVIAETSQSNIHSAEMRGTLWISTRLQAGWVERGRGEGEYLHGSFNDFISPVSIQERLEDFLHYKF